MIKRKWDANVALLIIFGITLVIATGTIGLISLYYKKGEKNEKYIYILGNKFASLKEIKWLWLCKTSSFWVIHYNPIKDTYKLTCEHELGKDINNFPNIITITKCTPRSTICEYKFKK